jgi:dsDNA-specific endonuclease/ATPase MutS2
MPSRLTFAVVALLAALVAGATACGGDDSSEREDYEATVVDTRNRVEIAFANISEAQSREDFSKRMEEASVAIDRAVDDLGEAEIAEGFEDETERLAKALRQLATDLEATAEQLRLTPELFNSRGLSFEGWTKANQIFTSLSKQGIQVRPLDKH